MRSKNAVIIGSGTHGTACALRLFRAGFGVIIFEKYPPVDIYHHLTFSSAYFSGKRDIDDITARTLPGAVDAGLEPDISVREFVNYQIKNREIPLLTQDQAADTAGIQIDYLIFTDDHFQAEEIKGISDQTKLLSIGFIENADNCRYIIADDPVYFGQVLYPFQEDKIYKSKETDSGPETQNTIAAPLDGVFTSLKQAGDDIYEKEEAGRINDIPILSPFSGRITGLLNSGMLIKAKTVFAEISSIKSAKSTSVLPQSSFALAGGVLEALVFDLELEG